MHRVLGKTRKRRRERDNEKERECKIDVIIGADGEAS